MDENPKIEKYEFDGVGLSTAERHKAEKQFEEYRNKYHIENLSDLQLLAEKVFRETLQIRIKKKIGKLAKTKKLQEENIVPSHMMRTMNENLDKILIINDKLGLNVEKQKGEHWLDFWGRFQKKLQIYAETHKAECTFKCPSCGEYALLLKKIDDYNVYNFNLLRGTFVYSKELMEEIEKKNLTKERVAKIIGCSIDYIEGLYNNVYLKEKRQDSK